MQERWVMDSNSGNRLLIDAVPEKTFYLSDGKPIRNLSELISELEGMDQNSFSYHCNLDKDDFAVWIDDALKMGELATILRGIKDKDGYIKAIRTGTSHQAVTTKSSVEEDAAKVESLMKRMQLNPPKDLQKTDTKKDIRKTADAGSRKTESKAALKVPEIPKWSNKTPEATIPKTFLDQYAQYPKDLARLKADIDNVIKINSELAKKIDAVDKTNSDLTKRLESLTRINAELVKRIEDSGKSSSEMIKRLDNADKANSESVKRIDDVAKANSELGKRTEILSKNIAEAPLPEIVLKSVSNYFDGKEFRGKVMEMFNPIIVGIHEKERNALKAEAKSVMDMNSKLDKKIALSLVNRSKETEKIAQKHVTEALNARMIGVGERIEKVMESKIARMEQAFDKKAVNIADVNLTKFRNDVTREKHDLRALAADAMYKEFAKVFNDDQQMAKIVERYQKIFNESVEHTAKRHKDYEDRFNDDLVAIKDKITLESQDVLNKQLTDTIKRQRDVLDTELAKALNSNRYFISRFEKEVLSREKMLLESADRKLKENYTKHDGMLASEFHRYQHELGDLKIAFDKEFKERESQFNESINSKIHLALNKEFSDILVNQRNELSATIGAVRTSAINKIDAEFTEVLSKHKEFMLEQFNKANSEQVVLKEKFLAELKSEEDKLLSKLKDTLQRDMIGTLKDHRELLDKELEKTVLANRYFVERYEKEIRDMGKKLMDSGAKMFEENYAKHKAMMQDTHAKQLTSLKTIVMETDTDIANKESKMLTDLSAIIPASVREAINKEFNKLIMDERKALEIELHKAEETNKEIEAKFEGALREKAEMLIGKFNLDMNTKVAGLIAAEQAKINALVALQQSKLDQELKKARESYEFMEGKKNEIIEKANTFLQDMGEYSSNKLKELEREHDKHIKKVSQITVLITKAEDALDDLKELKTQVNNDKKNISKENKDYSKLMAELNDLKSNLSQEKKWISLYREKVNIYNMIRQCSEFIRMKDAHNARLLYNKIAEAYAKTDFNEADKVELYNAATILLKESKKTFHEEKKNG